MPEGMAWHSFSNPWIQMFLDQRCEPLPRPNVGNELIDSVMFDAATQNAHVMKLYDATQPHPCPKNAKCGQGMGGSYATVIWFTKAERQCVYLTASCTKTFSCLFLCWWVWAAVRCTSTVLSSLLSRSLPRMCTSSGRKTSKSWWHSGTASQRVHILIVMHGYWLTIA